MINILKNGARSAIRSIRKHSDSNLFWWQGPPYNSGDWVGPFLFKKLSGIDPVFKTTSNKSLSTVYLTVGSLTRWICQDSIVWGSGLLSRNETFWQPHATYAVRGPYTRERFLQLGYECPEVYGDPAILLPLFLSPERSIKYNIGIIPHYGNIEEALNIFSSLPDVLIIDIRDPLEVVIENILSCEHILSSSLHGLIFSHSYKIPAGHIEFSARPGGDGVKFLDYYASGSICKPEKPLMIENQMPTSVLEEYAKSSPMPNLPALISPLLNSCPFIKEQDTLLKHWKNKHTSP